MKRLIMKTISSLMLERYCQHCKIQSYNHAKDLKSLLKKVEKEEDGFSSSSEEEEEDDDKFDPNTMDMYPTPKPKSVEPIPTPSEEPRPAKPGDLYPENSF